MAPPGLARRDSMQQPAHRRPFYGKDEQSHNTYMTNNGRPALVAKANRDRGDDNFSYDPVYLEKYKMPEGLAEILPAELKYEAQTWQLSAAALLTKLEHLEKLDKEAVDHAYPVLDHPLAVQAAETLFGEEWKSEAKEVPVQSEAQPSHEPPSDVYTPVYSPTPLVPSMAPTTETLERLLLNASLYDKKAPFGVESPPLTPVDSVTTTTPNPSFSKPRTATTSFSHESSHLAEASSTRATTPETGPESGPKFHENSWTDYLNKYHFHLEEMTNMWKIHVRGHGLKINIVVAELNRRKSNRDMVAEFLKWWGPLDRFEMDDLNKRVDDVEVPQLRDVHIDHQVQMHLAAGGRPGRVFSLSD